MSKCIHSLQAQTTPGVTLKAHPNTAWFDAKHRLHPQPQTLDSETPTVPVPAPAAAPAFVPAPTAANSYFEVLTTSMMNQQQMMQQQQMFHQQQMMQMMQMNPCGGHLS